MSTKAAKTATETMTEAFAPAAEAFKTLQSKMEVPEAAREFVKKAADTAQTTAADLHQNAEKLTPTLETAVTNGVAETAKIARTVQGVVFADVTAYFANLTKIASAKSLNEAVQIQADYFRAQGELAVSRTKSTTEYVTKMVADNAKTAQENLSKVVPFGKKAA